MVRKAFGTRAVRASRSGLLQPLLRSSAARGVDPGPTSLSRRTCPESKLGHSVAVMRQVVKRHPAAAAQDSCSDDGSPGKSTTDPESLWAISPDHLAPLVAQLLPKASWTRCPRLPAAALSRRRPSPRALAARPRRRPPKRRTVAFRRRSSVMPKPAGPGARWAPGSRGLRCYLVTAGAPPRIGAGR